MLKSRKKAQIKLGLVNTTILGIVVLVVLLNIYAGITPTAQAAGDSLGDAERCSVSGGVFNDSQALCLNGTNPGDTGVVSFNAIPLAGLFSGSGVVFIIIIAALLFIVVRGYLTGR